MKTQSSKSQGFDDSVASGGPISSDSSLSSDGSLLKGGPLSSGSSLGAVVLEARQITKRFPGVWALNRVDLTLRVGEVNAILGENGAGKSTLMNILSGVYTEYEGEILMDGEVQHFRGTVDAQRKGIAIIHQELNLIPYMDVAENIFLGREPLTPLGLVDSVRMHREAEKILSTLHLGGCAGKVTAELRVGQQQIVEIAKALSLNARVLIMDEPTSALSQEEVDLLFGLVRELKAKGVSIVYITHKMDEVRQLADSITILRDGCLVDAMPLSETDFDTIIRKMVGRSGKDFFVKSEHPKGDVRLELRHVSMDDAERPGHLRLDDINLQVRSGEVLGIYGLMGAGRTELFETVFGLHPREMHGEIRVDGRLVTLRHPKEAVEAGIALVPEDRRRDGLVLGMDIQQNASLPSLDDCRRWLMIDPARERQQAEDYRTRLSIKSFSVGQTVGELSGGNQQKVVLAKWLQTAPRIMLFDEPTRGIDIQAKNEIYRLLDDLAAQGMALVVVSSELPEIMAVSDRILTLSGGRLTAEFARAEFAEEVILKAALPSDE